MPLEMTKTMVETLKQGAPPLVVRMVGQNGRDNVVLSHKRAPFNNTFVSRDLPGARPSRLCQ